MDLVHTAINHPVFMLTSTEMKMEQNGPLAMSAILVTLKLLMKSSTKWRKLIAHAPKK